MNTFIQQAYGDGVTRTFAFTFPIIVWKDILVFVDGKDEGNWTLSKDGSAVVLRTPPANGALVTIERYTDLTPLVAFKASAILTQTDQNLSLLQTIHIAEEARDFANATVLFNPRITAYDAKGHKISNVGIAINDTDVVTMRYLDAAITASGFVRPLPSAIAEAAAAVHTYLLYIIDEAALEFAKKALIDADIAAMKALLAELNSLNANPPPDGETIVARLDALFGSTVWRTPVATTPSQQIFDASGTWTKPAKGDYVMIECWGGGGAGASNSASNVFYSQGSCCTVSQPGGGGGSYSRRIVLMDDLPASVAVTVGQGGAPQYGFGSGMNGGDSSFGSILSAKGGRGAPSIYSGGPGAGPTGSDGGLYGGTTYYANWLLGGLPRLRAAGASPGDPGYMPPWLGYSFPGRKALGGIFHGGGGGAGQKGLVVIHTDPRTSHYAVVAADQFNAMDGGGSVYGGGGGGGGFTYPGGAGGVGTIQFSVPGTTWPQSQNFAIPASWRQGYGGPSQYGGRGGDGGTVGQNGQDGGPRGGGGGGAGVAAGSNYMTVTNGPLGGHGGRGEVRITVW